MIFQRNLHTRQSFCLCEYVGPYSGIISGVRRRIRCFFDLKKKSNQLKEMKTL